MEFNEIKPFLLPTMDTLNDMQLAVHLENRHKFN